MAELTVDLSTLANGEEVEEWYPLSGITPIGEWGSIRLRTRYFLILRSNYHNFIHYFFIIYFFQIYARSCNAK